MRYLLAVIVVLAVTMTCMGDQPAQAPSQEQVSTQKPPTLEELQDQYKKLQEQFVLVQQQLLRLEGAIQVLTLQEQEKSKIKK